MWGITVFGPLIQNKINSTNHVGIVGMGGLGHMAILFLKAWGCEITVFSTNLKKQIESKRLGADHFLNSISIDELKKISNKMDLIIVTSNAELNWDLYINALNPGGKLHRVGAADKINTSVFPLISHERSIGGSPTG